MALGQYRDPGHAVRLEVVHVDMQQGRLRGVHTTPQGRLDQIDVVEAFGPVQIDNEMDPGTTHAVTNGEVVLAIFGRRRLHDRNVSDILSGGGWYPQVIGSEAGVGTDRTAGKRARFFITGKSERMIEFER